MCVRGTADSCTVEGKFRRCREDRKDSIYNNEKEESSESLTKGLIVVNYSLFPTISKKMRLLEQQTAPDVASTCFARIHMHRCIWRMDAVWSCDLARPCR